MFIREGDHLVSIEDQRLARGDRKGSCSGLDHRLDRRNADDGNIESHILIGLSDDTNASLAPVDCVFATNRIVAPKHSIIEARCSIDGIRWGANQFFGKALGIAAPAGIEMTAPNISPLSRISRTSVGATW